MSTLGATGGRALLLSSLAVLAACAAESVSRDRNGALPVRHARAPQSVCGSSPSDGSVGRDSAGIEIVENWSLAKGGGRSVLSDQPILTIGSEAIPETQFVSVVSAARLTNRSIVVADGRTLDIRVFDADGQFVETIGRKGGGPGEYGGGIVGMWWAPGDSLAVNDFGSGPRVTVVASDGSVGRVVRLPMKAATSVHGDRSPPNLMIVAVPHGMLGDGSFVGVKRIGGMITSPPAPGSRVVVDSVAIVGVDAQGQDERLLGLGIRAVAYHVVDSKSFRFMEYAFGPVGRIAVGSRRFWYGDGARFEVREHEANGGLARLTRVCDGGFKVTPEYAARYRAVEVGKASPASWAAELDGLIAGMPLPPVAAAFTELTLGRDGRLWVGEFALGDEPRIWRAFNAAGEWIGWMETPAGTHVLEIGADYLIAKRKDADDVESVVVFSLTTP